MMLLDGVEKINSDNSVITRNGKNWYVHADACIITVNAYSYTIITEYQTVNRARILLLKADGYSVDDIADKVGINRKSVMLVR